MNTTTWKNRALSVVLTVIMVFSVLPLSAFATDGGAANGAVRIASTGNVAEVIIDGTTTGYTDIDAAFAAAQEAASATIKLLADVTISHTDDTYGIQLEKGNITLELNGMTISQRSGIARNKFYAYSAVFYLSVPREGTTTEEVMASLKANVRLTVQDSVGGGKIVQPNGGPAVVAAGNGTLTVNSGVIENTFSDDFDDGRFHMTPNCAVLLSDGGKAVINGGTLSGMRGVAVAGYITKEVEQLYKDYLGIEGYNNDTYGNELTVAGGEISGTSGNALIVYDKAKKIELSGGTFTTQSNEHSIWAADSTPEGENPIKGDAASLLAAGYRYENNGAECAYSAEGNGVVGNATVALRPANETAYIGADGKLTARADCTEITAETDDISHGWYVLKEDVTVSLLNISEEVHLILCDGATLTVSSYFNVGQDSTLNLYWQSAGSGKLTAKAIGMMGSVTAPAGGMKQTADASGTTFEKCFEHDWGYTNNGDTHTATCKLCGKAEAAESHKYESWTSTDADTHTGTCVCGATSTENHTLTLAPNDDGLTHSTKCSVCDYATAAETHDFSSTDIFGDKKCACGVRLTAEYDGKRYATLASAIEAAKDGGTVTLQADVPENITIEDGTNVTIDLNGKKWAVDGNKESASTLTVTGGDVTVQNGTLTSGSSSKAAIAVVVEGGKLTVGEGMTIQGGSMDKNKQFPAIEVAKSGELSLCVGAELGFGMKVSAEGKQLKDYLPEGTAFTVNGSVINGYVQELSGNFTLVVAAHTSHSYDTDGKCACGAVCTHSGGTAGYFQKAKCAVCGAEYGELLTDTTPPTGTITVKERTPFQTFINKITFGLFFKADVTATVTATDDSYKHEGYDKALHAVKIRYLISDREFTKEELPAQSFTEYTKPIDLSDEQSYVVYACITDYAGNVAYISGDGFVIDKTVPDINGYRGTKTVHVCDWKYEVKVEDKYLKTVTVDGVEKQPSETIRFDYLGEESATHTVVAEDEAGNKSEITFILHPQHNFDSETGACKNGCGTVAAVKVQVGDGDVELYETFDEAWGSWGTIVTEPVTLTLMKNVAPDSVGLGISMELTMDLNGHSFGRAGLPFALWSGTEFTITGAGQFVPTLEIFSGSSLTVEPGVTYVGAIKINTSEKDGLTDWSVALKGGKYGELDMRYTDRDGIPMIAAACGELVAPGYVFDRDDEVFSEPYATDVTVILCTNHNWIDGVCDNCNLVCTHDWVGSKCTVCGYECLHSSVEERGGNTYCTEKCGQQMAVKVKNGDTETYYAKTFDRSNTENTLQTVLNDDTATPSGSTITLLANDLLAFAFVDDGKNIKLDLNGKNLIETVNNGIAVDPGSTLTVTGEGSSTRTGNPDNKEYSYVFNVRGGTLVFKEMEFGGTFNGIRVGSGTLLSPREKPDSITIGNLKIDNVNAKISFKSVTIGKIIVEDMTAGASVTLGDLLGVWKDSEGNAVRSGNAFRYTAGDKAFVRYDTKITKDNPVDNIRTDACYHDSLGAENTCNYCGWTHLVAIYITDSGVVGTLNPATEWTEDAINIAMNTAFGTWNNMGGTLRLFADATLADRTITNRYATHIDLNGNKITGGTLTLDKNSRGNGTNVTVTDSSTGKNGEFANVTVNGGASLTVDGVKVGGVTLKADSTLTVKNGGILESVTAESGKLIDFLPEGYAFVGTDGKVKNAGTDTLENVTVARHTEHSYEWNTATHEHICGCGHVDKTDLDAPIFTDVENNGTYYNNKLTFTVNDAISGVKEVKDGDKLLTPDANGEYAITADNKEHTVTATDLAGNTATVKITVYKVYNVTLPAGTGYTVEGNPTVGHGQDYTFTVKITKGYSATRDFTVYLNGSIPLVTPDPDSAGVYTFTFPNAPQDLSFTVKGVADITAPDVEMTIGTNKFKELLNSLTYGLFFKKTQTVTVTVTDLGSGVAETAEYTVIDGLFDKETAPADGWTSFNLKNGKGSFSIAPNVMGSVYIRVTDKAGNVTVINSDGIVIYTDSEKVTDSVELTRLSKTDVAISVDLKGNTVKSISCGGKEIGSEWYEVLYPSSTSSSSFGTIMLKNGYLKTLAAGEYTVTVSYNPAGLSYREADGNEAPATTAVKLTVLKNTRSLTFEAPNAVYDGKEYDDLRITDKPGSTAIHYKAKGAEDSTYTTDAPKNAGSYTVRISVSADNDYNAATFTADFTVSPVEVTINGVTAESKTYNGNTEAVISGTAAPSVNYDGESLSVKPGKADFADKNVGTAKTVTFTDFELDGTAKNNYRLTAQPAPATANITAKELTVENLKVKDKVYDGTEKAEIDGTPTLNGVCGDDDVKLVCGKPTFATTAVGENITINFTAFTITGEDSGNYTVAQPGVIKARIKPWNADGKEFTVPTKKWSNNSFTVTANDGYKLSLSDTATGDWKNELTVSDETDSGTLTFYVKNTATEAISTAVTVNYKIDKTAPTGAITLNGRTPFQKFISNITFGLFFKDDVTVKLTAGDEASGVKSVEYYKSDKALTLAEVKSLADWTAGDSFGITAEDMARFVIYARITDNAGNITYLSSDGAEFDTTVPEIVGVENGETYYVTQRVAFDDANLESVTVNGKSVDKDAPFDLVGDKNAVYKIVATDKAGNVTEYTVTMKPISDITDAIKDITEENVTSADADTIDAVTRQILDIAAESEEDVIGEEQWSKLTEAAANCKKLQTRIANVAAEIARLNDAVGTYDIDKVTSADKADIERLIADIDVLLGGSNLTDTERAALEALKQTAQALLDRIADAKDAAESDEITAVEDITEDNVTLDDKDTLETAKKALEDALDDFDGNYTEEERKSLNDRLDTVKAALDAIGNAEKAAEEIKKLPSADDVKLTDKDEIERISKIIDDLTDNEKSLLGEDALGKLKALNEKLTELADNAKKPTSPSTGDTSNLALWIALLFISGGVITGVTVAGKKKKQQGR